MVKETQTEQPDKLRISNVKNSFGNILNGIDLSSPGPGTPWTRKKTEAAELDTDSTEYKELLAKQSLQTKYLQALGDLNRVPSFEDFDAIRKGLIDTSSDKKAAQRTIDSPILELLTQECAFPMGVQYVNFLLENNYLNPGSLAQAVTHLYTCKILSPQHFNQELSLRLLEGVGTMLQINSVLHPFFLQLLCCSGHWREARELCLQSDEAVMPKAANAIAIEAFDHGEPEEGWTVLKKMLDVRDFAHGFGMHTQLAAIRHAKRLAANKDFNGATRAVKRFLKFLELFHVYPSKDVVEELSSFFKMLESHTGSDVYSVAQTTVSSKTGQCRTCKEVLKPVYLLPSEYQTLLDGIRSYFIEGKVPNYEGSTGDSHRDASPQEKAKFLQFMDKVEPFNLVIDGLNLYFASYVGFTGEERLVRMATCIEYLRNGLKGNPRVLLLMRSHVLRKIRNSKMGQEAVNRIKNMATIYLVQSTTKDDGFFLYAGVKSGPRSWLLTNDRMGVQLEMFTQSDHRLWNIMKRYLAKRQIVYFFDKRDGKPIFIFPFKHEVSAQCSEKGQSFHVPFDDGSDRYTYQLPNDWLCVRRKEPIRDSVEDTVDSKVIGGRNGRDTRNSSREVDDDTTDDLYDEKVSRMKIGRKRGRKSYKNFG